MKKIFHRIQQWLRRHRVKIICTGVTFTLILIFLWPSIFVTIRPGHLGVLFSRFFGGTIMNRTYDEGVHIILPWDKMYIYDVRIQEETQDINVLTLDGLTVSVQVSLRFQLIRDNLPQLHRNIGPEYERKIVTPIMNSAVRQTIGSYRPDALYSTARQVLQDQMLVESIEEMGRIPILIHGFVVKGIVLPQNVNNAIESKLIAEQDYLRYFYLVKQAKEEAKRKAIEGYGIQYYQSLVNSNMTPNFLLFEGIKATKALAASKNAKIVVVGGGKNGLPLILNTDSVPATPDGLSMNATGSAIGVKPRVKASVSVPQKNNINPINKVKIQNDFIDFVKKLDQTLLNPNLPNMPEK